MPQCRGQLLLVNLLKHTHYGAEVTNFVSSSELEKQNFVPDVWHIVLANISIKGRVVDSDVYCFFYGPGHMLSLPAYYPDIFHCCCVASSVLMLKNLVVVLLLFLVTLFKSSG